LGVCKSFGNGFMGLIFFEAVNLVYHKQNLTL